jgi:hypothetical protein
VLYFASGQPSGQRRRQDQKKFNLRRYEDPSLRHVGKSKKILEELKCSRKVNCERLVEALLY